MSFCLSDFFFFAAVLEYRGIIWHTTLFTFPYKIRGLDVSHHQGDIDWNQISPEEYRFVFIKATEGDSFVDHAFEENWREAREQGIYTGAYHFYSAAVSGESQAENILRTVPNEYPSLPVVIDIEIRPDHNPAEIRENLAVMIRMINNKYGKPPILYVTNDTFQHYVRGYFPECDIWIRNILKHPQLEKERDWLFWQYCNRGRVSGIVGYVDINVFAGDAKTLTKLLEDI